MRFKMYRTESVIANKSFFLIHTFIKLVMLTSGDTGLKQNL